MRRVRRARRGEGGLAPQLDERRCGCDEVADTRAELNPVAALRAAASDGVAVQLCREVAVLAPIRRLVRSECRGKLD